MIKGYTYILTNINQSVLYVGASRNLKNWIDCHKNGTRTIFTKNYNAIILLYFEESDDLRVAFDR